MGNWVAGIIKTGKWEKEWLEVEILDLRGPGAIQIETYSWKLEKDVGNSI